MSKVANLKKCLPAVRVGDGLKQEIDRFARETDRTLPEAVRHLVGAGLRAEAREESILSRVRELEDAQAVEERQDRRLAG